MQLPVNATVLRDPALRLLRAPAAPRKAAAYAKNLNRDKKQHLQKGLASVLQLQGMLLKSGKRCDSDWRFILPSFTEENLTIRLRGNQTKPPKCKGIFLR